MNTDKIKQLSALCKRWEEITAERADIEAQIENLIAPEAKTVEPVSDQIRVGDLVEVVSATGFKTEPDDVGSGGVVKEVDIASNGKPFVMLTSHPSYKRLPYLNMAALQDCRKVAAHARPGAGS